MKQTIVRKIILAVGFLVLQLSEQILIRQNEPGVSHVADIIYRGICTEFFSGTAHDTGYSAVR